MTYGEIRLRVTQEAPGIGVPLVDGYLLDRYVSILDRLKWSRQGVSTTINTVAGTSVYALPASWKLLGEASIPADSVNLERMPRATLEATAPGRPASGPPRIVSPALDSSATPPTLQIELYPVPDDVYVVSVSGTAEAPSITGSSTAVLPWLRPSCLIAGATADALEHLKDYRGADRKEIKFEKYLADMIRNEAYERGPQPLKVAGWLTRHNLQRAIRSSTQRTGPRLP